MNVAFGVYGNPGSIHSDGVRAKAVLSEAREVIAQGLGCKSREIVFTSGGTEGNNLAILGSARGLELSRRRLKGAQGVASEILAPLAHTHWIVGSIEHPSVLECFAEIERMGGEVSFVDPDAHGTIRPEAIALVLRKETVFVSIGWANSEIGIIQPLARIARVIRAHEEKHHSIVVFHSDAGQAPLYEASHVHSLGVDLLTLDSGKLYGPRGIGCVYIHNRVTLAPVQLGGSQERGLRAGTENVVHAVGFAQACTLIAQEREKESRRLQKMRENFARKILALRPDIILNTDLKHSLPHILNISIPHIQSEYLVLALDHAGVSLSTKSACKEGDEQQSHVVAAIATAEKEVPGTSFSREDRAKNTLRFSMGRETTQRDMDRGLDTLKKLLAKK
jgi:cysteine desulfurase